MVLGIGIIDGQCLTISGCGFEVNGVDYESYFFENMEDCESSCISSIELCVIPEIIDSSAACPEIYDPVCGCDGVDYINSCYARLFGGVTTWTNGLCTTGIEENTLDYVKVFPNPAKEILNIEFPEIEELSIRIIDMTGKIIFFDIINTSFSYDISYIKQGIYLLQMNDDNGNSTVRKLIIH
jgi:hypothetical protein